MPLALPIPASSPNLADNVAGGLRTAGGGRTDALPISVQPESFIVPADVVAALGEGNSAAGMRALDGLVRALSGPAPGLAGRPIQIAAAGGEFIIPPQVVAAVGHGDMDAGHAVLVALVKRARTANIKHLSSLPGPKR